MKYAFVNGIILDGTRDMEPLEGYAVCVSGERIEDIVKMPADLSGYEQIDLKGSYLLPGLINLHVHLATSGNPPKKEKKKPTNYKLLVQTLTESRLIRAIVCRQMAGYAKTELMSGVTTLRAVGGVLNFDSVIRDRINAGKAIGPRILAADMGISVPGGHFAGSIATESVSAAEAVQDIQRIDAWKPDLIKLMISGGVMDASKEGEPGILRMSPEIVKACCEEAHRLGYKVAAHVESPESVRVALENGVDTIEHGAAPDETILHLFKEHNAVHICTISPALPYAIFDLSESKVPSIAKRNGRIVMDGTIACAKACLANGIRVGLGNDVGCPFILHYSFWRELHYYHKYVGVSRKEALHAATLGNAEIIGLDYETGSIAKGKSADLIVVDKDPLQDLSALRNVTMVMARGHLIAHPHIKRNQYVDTLLDRYM